jgi:hypothetical protein
MKTVIATAALVVVFLLAGCQKGTDYSDLHLVDVTGKVTMDGQPLPGVTVRFEGPPLRFAEGKTDASGNYRLMYDSNQAGCLPGDKTVRIMSGPVGEAADEDAPGEGAVAVPISNVSIPAKYNRSSELRANVSPANKTFDFELKSTP